MLSHTFAVVVCYNGAQWLPETLRSLIEQQPDDIVVVDAGSTDDSLAIVAEHGIRRVVVVPPSTSFTDSVQRGLDAFGHQPTASDFIWILHDDSAPGPSALTKLLIAVEQNSNAVMFGPKLYQWDHPGVLESFGLTMTQTGIAVNSAAGERDQAQFDERVDALGLSTAGLLIRWPAWTELHGLDPALQHTDDGLDLGVRARLAGYRVVRVANAAMRHAAQAPRGVRRHDNASSAMRVRRAQLHRQLVYARQPWVFFVWLSLLPGAFIRSVWLLLKKRPGDVFDEWVAAVSAMCALNEVRSARSHMIRRERWSTLAPLRISRSSYRQWRLQSEPETSGTAHEVIVKAPFWTSSGPWLVFGACLLSIAMWWRLLGAQALAGGSALPLSPHIGTVWANALQTATDGLHGTTALPVPAAFLLAILATITFGAPSLSVVILWLVALPLATLGAYLAAGMVSTKSWPRAAAAILWTFFPPFLAALGNGQVFAVIGHLALPFALRLTILSIRSALTRSQHITCAAGAGLLWALATISSPSAAALFIVLWAIAMGLWRRASLLWIVVPTVAAWIPSIVSAAIHRQWFRLLVDPGLVPTQATAKFWQAALGMPSANPLGLPSIDIGPAWLRACAQLLPSLAILTTIILLVAVIVALLCGELRIGSFGLMGLLLSGVTAVVVQHVELYATAAPSMWAGAAISMGAITALPAFVNVLGRLRIGTRTIVIVVGALVIVPALPLALSALKGDVAVGASPTVRMPAIVSAQNADPRVDRVLVIDQRDDGALRLAVVGVDGETLDSVNNTALATRGYATVPALADAAAGLVLGTNQSATQTLHDHGLTFVLLQGDTDDRTVQRISSNHGLTTIGTTDFGHLWQLTSAAPQQVTKAKTAWPAILPIGIVGLVYLLLAIPTSRLPWETEQPVDPLADRASLDASDPFNESAVEEGDAS